MRGVLDRTANSRRAEGATIHIVHSPLASISEIGPEPTCAHGDVVHLGRAIAAFMEGPVFRLRMPVFSAEADGLAIFLSWARGWVVIGKLQSIYARSGRLAQLRNWLVTLPIT